MANSPSPYPKISTDIFNGALTAIQALSNGAFFGILIFMMASFFLVLWTLKSGDKKSKRFIALSLISLITIFASLRLSEGWDELFINLRHPYMLLEHGLYSINANTMLEASVDFLPLMLTALIAWTGIRLLNALLIMSLLGNALLIIITFFLVSRITKNDNWGLVSALCIGLYPDILFIGVVRIFGYIFLFSSICC